MSAKPLPPPLARSLQDLRHLKQALAQARADEQARLRTARELAEKTEAARHVFAHAVGKVRPLAGAHQSRVMLAPAPVLPRPLQRERDQEAVLREALSAPACQALKYHTQIRLEKLASPTNSDWTETQRAFMRRASCDFVIYFKVGKTPIGVIEVDGGYHDQPVQAARDAMKNEILNKCRVPILRLRTVDSGIKQRISDFLGLWMK